MADRPETKDMGSGVSGKPGLSYDPERLGEAGQPGVPTGDQYPTNERDGDSIVADVDVPGPYPSDGDTGEPLSQEPEPTKATRDASSLGDLTEAASADTTREETGGLGSPLYDDDKSTDK
jgi:hypothetical protein